MKNVSGWYRTTASPPMKIYYLRDRPVSVHIRNLEILATETIKGQRDLSPSIFKELFNKRTLNYELRHPRQLRIPRVESVYNGSESIVCLGPKIWNMVSSELEEMSSIIFFKKAIKECTLETVRVDYVGDTYNHFRNILRFFDVLTNFTFTKSETTRNNYL